MTIHYEEKKTYVQVIKIKYILVSLDTIGAIWHIDDVISVMIGEGFYVTICTCTWGCRICDSQVFLLPKWAPYLNSQNSARAKQRSELPIFLIQAIPNKLIIDVNKRLAKTPWVGFLS